MERSSTALCILLAVAMVLWNVVLGHYSINLDMSSTTVNQGGEVVITCRVTNRHNNGVTMSWVRKLEGEEEVEIGLNNHLNDDFQRIERYQVHSRVVTNFSEFEFTLQIKNAQASDSGEIGCLLPSNNIEIFKPLTVNAPVQVVKLSSKNLDNTHAVIYANDDRVVFKEGEVRRFFCKVQGSYPDPTVRVFVGSLDITESFNRTSDLVKNGPKRNGGKFIKELFYKVNLTNDRLNISHEFNGKNITCVAGLAQTNFPSKNASIAVTLSSFPPKFECLDHFFAKMYERDVTLRCRVIGEPQVHEGRFYWRRKTQGNMSVEAGNTNGIYSGLLASAKSDGLVKEMALKISRVFPQSFRSYYFEAKNEEGMSVKEILLREVFSDNNRSTGITVFHQFNTMMMMTTTLCLTVVIITATAVNVT